MANSRALPMVLCVLGGLLGGAGIGWFVTDTRASIEIRDLQRRLDDTGASVIAAEASGAEALSDSEATIEGLKTQIAEMRERLSAATTISTSLTDSLKADLAAARRRMLTAEACVDQLVQAYNRSTTLTLPREFSAALLGGDCGPLGYR